MHLEDILISTILFAVFIFSVQAYWPSKLKEEISNMYYKNLKGKYTIKIVAVNNENKNLVHDLFATPVEDFGGTLMRVIKDSVHEKLSALDTSCEQKKKHCENCICFCGCGFFNREHAEYCDCYTEPMD